MLGIKAGYSYCFSSN